MSRPGQPPWKATQRIRPAAAPEPGAPDPSWREGAPAVLGEHRDGFAGAESEVAYRWIAPVVAGRSVLDVGCGAGHGVGLLERAGAQSPVGAGTDPLVLEAATRAYGERIRFIEAEPIALPLADNSFDVVTCFGPLEESADPDSVLDQLCRVLAPGGYLAVSLPLAPPRDPIDGEPLTEASSTARWRRRLESRFANVETSRRRSCFAAAVLPNDTAARDDGSIARFENVGWLGAESAEDRALLAISSNSELPELPTPAVLVGSRDVAAYRDTIAAWEQRARKAEADGAAKHWELVASREAQRRLRKRLYSLEHTLLRKLFRVVRGRPARIGEGPPIRDPEREPEAWD